MADLGEQLKIQKQINSLLEARSKLIEKQSSLMKTQAALAEQMKVACDNKQVKKLENSVRGTSGALDEAATSAEQAGDKMGAAFEKSSQKAGQLSESFERLRKKSLLAVAATSALKGFGAGLKWTKNIIMGFVSGVGTLISTFGGLAFQMISLPFKMLAGLFDMAQSGSISPFRVALEEVRKEFGSFREGVGKDMVDGLRTMRRGMGRTAEGISKFGRIFGYGREGMAAGMKYAGEMAKAIGPSFTSMSGQFKKDFGNLTKFQKGLGIAMEDFGKIIANSKASGTDYNKTLTEMGHYAEELGKKFGIPAKTLSRGAGKMAANMKYFGDVGPKALIETMVYTKKLGISMKTLQGVIDGFDNFEDAAENAALLRRQFGMIIDAEKMMTMTSTERIEYQRKQFAKTGKSFEKMGRIEKDIFAKRMKMEVEEAAAIFGKGKKKVSLGKIEKAGDKAANKRISQTKVLRKLMTQIERVFGSGTKKQKGFFAAFADGFGLGVRRTREFYTLMRNIRLALMNVRNSGRQVGRAFVKHFPGVKQMIKGLSDFFDPAKFYKNSQKLTLAFTTFFKDLNGTAGPRAAIDKLMGSLREAFSGFFGDNGDGLKSAASGFETFTTLVGNIKIMLLERAVEGAATFIEAFTAGLQSIIDNGNPLEGTGSKLGNKITEKFGDSFSRLKDVFKDKLLPALIKAGPVVLAGIKILWGKIKDYATGPGADLIVNGLIAGLKAMLAIKWKVITTILSDHWDLVLLLLVPAMVSGLMSMLGSLLAAKLAILFTGAGAAGGAGLLAGLGSAIAGGASAIAGGIGAILASPLLLPAAAVAAVGATLLNGVTTAMDEYSRPGSTAWSTTAAVGAGIFEAVTLGFLDADETMDTWFGGTRRSSALAAEYAEQTKQGMEEVAKRMQPIAAAASKALDALSKIALKTGSVFAAAARTMSGVISTESSATLKALQKMSGASADAATEADKKLKALGAKNKLIGGAAKRMMESIKDSSGTALDSNAELGFTDAERKAGTDVALSRALQMAFNKDGDKNVWMEDGVLKIDDAFWDGNQAKIQAVMDSMTSSKAMKNQADMIKNAALKTEEQVMTFSKEALLNTHKEMSAAGAGPEQLAAVADQLKKKTQLEAMKSIMAQEGLAVGQDGIRASFNRYLETANGNTKIALNDALKKANEEASAQLSPVVTEAQKQARKLSALEVAKDTMNRMKELQNVPAELKTLQTEFDKINMEEVKTKVTSVFTKVGQLTDEISSAMKTAGLTEKKDVISASSLQAIGAIQQARQSIDAIIGKKTVTKSLTAAREENIKAGITAAGNIAKALNTDINLLTSIGPTTLASLSTLQSAVNLVGGPHGIFTVVPEGIKKRIKAAKSAIDEVGAMVRALNNNPELKMAVAIGETMSQGKDIAVEVKRTSVRVHLQLNIDAKELAGKLIDVDLQDGEGVNKILTQKDVATT